MAKTNKTRNNGEKIRPFGANIDELPQYLCRTHFIYKNCTVKSIFAYKII